MAKMTDYVPFLLSWEGGYSKDPDDRGGFTQHGVTMDYYRRWCEERGYARPSLSDLKLMTMDRWQQIVKTHWDQCSGNLLSQPVANLIVDTLWTCGNIVFTMVNRAGRVFCKNQITEQQAETLNKFDQHILFDDLHEARQRYYQRICQYNRKNLKFINGWLRRLNSITYGKLYYNQ